LNLKEAVPLHKNKNYLQLNSKEKKRQLIYFPFLVLLKLQYVGQPMREEKDHLLAFLLSQLRVAELSQPIREEKDHLLAFL
jgi:hypothetical protein